MDYKVRTILNEYEKRELKELEIMSSLSLEEGFARRDEFLLSIGEDVARFVNSLVKGSKSKIILEVGTSYGYSTIWLAEAAKSINGKIISIEIDPYKSQYAKEQLKIAGLEQYVDFKIGDAVNIIKSLDINFDFVLLDLWKELYVPCFKAFYPKLNRSAFIVADNMIFPEHHKEDVKLYKKEIAKTISFDTVLIPIGQGIEVSRFK